MELKLVLPENVCRSHEYLDLPNYLGVNNDILSDIIKNKGRYYHSYPVEKSDRRSRWIDAPLDPLLEIQHNILNKILYKFEPHEASHGFIKERGVITNALKHIDNNTVLNMDIQDFFGSINYNMVMRLIASLIKKLSIRRNHRLPLFNNPDIYNTITKLVTYKNRLPQGAPTSPAIANIYCISLDRKLNVLAKEHNVVYTRYADDLSFSHKNKNFNIDKLIEEISKIVREEKLKIKKKKTKIARPNNRMMVTGVVINERLSVPKWKWRNFRAALHNIITNDIKIDLDRYRQLYGYAEWIGSLHPKRGNRFKEQLREIKEHNIRNKK